MFVLHVEVKRYFSSSDSAQYSNWQTGVTVLELGMLEFEQKWRCHRKQL